MSASDTPKTTSSRIKALQDRIREIDAKLELKSTFLAERPGTPALSARQRYEAEIVRRKRVLRNDNEVIIKNFERLILEAKQRVSEEKAYQAAAAARLEAIAVIDCQPHFLAQEREMEEISWRIESGPEKLKSYRANVTMLERLPEEKRRATVELIKKIHGLKHFDALNQAGLEAEIQALTGWSNATENKDSDSDDADDDASDGQAEQPEEKPKGSASRTTLKTSTARKS